MLILRETVKREVECDNTWYPDPNHGEAHCVCGFMVLNETGKIIKKELSCGSVEMECSACHGTGHRTVVYQVEAEVDFEEMSRFNIRLYARHVPQYGEHMRSIRHGRPIALAEKLLTAHLAGEELPGVNVTEVLDGSDEEDEYTRARHGERVEEPCDT